MIAKAGKKLLASVLALTLVLGNVPAIAFAGSAESNPLQDGTLAVTYDTEANAVTVDKEIGAVHVNAESVDTGTLGSFLGSTVTATLTNQSGTQQILSFDYSVQGNRKEMTIGDQAYSGTGTWTGIVEAGASMDVVLSGNDTDGDAKMSMGNFVLTDNNAKKVIFAESENGTVSVSGTVETTYTDGVTATAAAAEGYQFVAWVDENNQILSADPEATLHLVKNCTVKAVFAGADEAYFKAAGKLFTDLNEAAAYARESGTGVVVPMKDGTVPAGDYVIPQGVTLLIPFDAEESCYLDKGQTSGTEYVEPVAYRTLTFAEGANMTVNGELSVSARHTSGFNSTKTGGTPNGPVGMIDLKEGSTITIADGASAYAWGYIIGSGNMIAESGSSIYEIMQIADFRGGSQTKDLLSTPVLPFSQYYIQNIEAPLTLYGGASEYAFTTLTATLGQTITASAGIKFIGTSDAMFCLEEGTTVTKVYDAQRDRLVLTVNGDFSLNSMTLSVMGIEMNTSGFNLPINNNISIDIQSGTAVIGQNTAFLPGVEISVEEGANVKVASETNLYIYDEDDWGGYNFGGVEFVDIAYSPTKEYTRTVENDIKDVVLDINGLFIAEGNVYTTAGGAQVISSEGTGAVEFKNAAGTATVTQQADGNGTLVDIGITSVKLQNQDGTYVETSTVADGDGFVSDNGTWIPATDVTLTYDANGGISVEDSNTQTISKQNVLTGTKTTLKAWANVVSNEGYVFKGWNTAADGSGKSYTDREAVKFVKDTTLYAQWEGESHTFTFITDGGTVIEPITAPYGSTITPPADPTREGYTFNRWHMEIPTTMPGYDLSFKALWTPIDYTITFDTDGGSDVAPITQGYETALTEPAAPTKAGYTFAGWEPEFPKTMPLNGMELKAKWEVAKYTISFDTDGGSEVADITGEYGSAVTAPAAPTKEGYTFAGWDADIPETMPANDMTLKAIWKVNQYTITFDTDGGSTVAPITQDYDSLITPPAAPVKEGYTFAGWSSEVPGKMPAENLTLTAKWDIIKSTITFDTDGGTEIPAMKADYGSAVTAPADPTKEGYTFIGWSMDIPETMPAEDLTVQALWKINQYTVSFETEGGTQIAPVTKNFGTELTLDAPTRDGYIFLGWELDGKMVESGFTVPAKNVMLKAVWEEDAAVVVTFMDDDGKEYQVSGKKGQPMTIPQVPAREGYTLTWTPAVPDVFPTENTTYYAVWEVNQYTITFDTDGGSKVESITADYGETVVAPAAPEKEGYLFKSWSPALPETMPAQNMTVKATYHKVVIDPAKEATCTETGETEGKHCADCGEVFVEKKETPMLKHKEVTVPAEPATTEDSGLTAGKKCEICGTTIVKQETVAAIDSVELSYEKKVYTGKNIAAPQLTVTDTEGNKIISYDVTGLTGKTAVGRYKVTVTFKGNYEGTEELYFTIVPKKVSSITVNLNSADQKNGYNDVKATWKKSTGANGYMVYYKKASASKWSSPVSTTKTTYTKKNLAAGTKYTFKVVPYYKAADGKKYYDTAQYKSASTTTLKKVTGVKVVKSGTKVKVSWTNINGETGYQISKMTKKSATQKTPLTVKSATAKSKLVKATKGKTYYYKVRAYKTVDGKKIYGPWSVVKAFKRK